jgi:hypothetical protein
VLRSGRLTGQVLAAFSRSFYIIGPKGQILWVAQPPAVLHRRIILAPFEPLAVKERAGVQVSAGQLMIEGLRPIAFSQAATWIAEPIKRSQITPLKALTSSLDERLAWISELPGRRGLGHDIGSLIESQPTIPAHEMDGRDGVFWEAAKGMLEQVVQASREGNVPEVLRAGTGLLGLGLGLTPSGDDYMGGLLFTAHHLAKAYPGSIPYQPEALHHFLALSRSATNLISRAILSDLVHGHGPEPLHELVSAVIRGDIRSEVEASARRLAQIGHSSGWDMLAGAATGFLLLTKHEKS